MFHPPRRIPLSLIVIFALCVLGYFAVELAPRSTLSLFGLVPVRVTRDFWLWQMVTYMALHGSLVHLLFNMLSFYLFGVALSDHWGEQRFVSYFLFCGIGAALVTLLVMAGSPIPTIGASGAIYGILYAWAREFPDSIIYLYGLFPMRARHFVIVLAVVELMLSQTPSPIARFAHLGGLAAGWLYFRLPDLSGLFKKFPIHKIKWEKAVDPQEEVDRILEKISREGLQALTNRERTLLERASRKTRKT